MEAGTRSQNTATDESPRSAPPVLPWTLRLRLFASTAGLDLAERRDGTVNRFLLSLADRQSPASPRSASAPPTSPSTRPATSGHLSSPRQRGRRLRRRRSPSSSTSTAAASRSSRALGRVHVRRRHVPPFLPRAGRRRRLRHLTYRLAPEHRYPAAYDDCADVLRYLGATGLPADVASPVDLSRCFLAGDSAGGNIAHHVAHRWTSSSNSPIRLAGVILLQPYFGGEERTEAELRLEGVAPLVNMRRSDWSWRAFLPEGADRNHPAAHVTGEAGPEPELAEAFPPAMVVVGGFDPLQDWQRRYAAMLRRKGKAVRLVEFPDAFHAFYGFPELPDAGRVVEEMKAFIESTSSIHGDPAA
uniref:Alpha/beta hydrolase fold-3 domain-containing protein n=1 Tax=Triticum urartu TaxID=4572 RepID=A0A8R7V5C8_TRIUA